jgi:protein disulfide-isomerase-like protein
MIKVLLAAILVACVSAGDGPSDVLVLDPSNFDAHVGGDVPVFVEFYAPWCGHCKALAPEFDILATSFRGQSAKIASVDADKHRDLGGRFDVKGFPTIKYFPAGSQKPEDYSGGRTAADMIDFVNGKAGTNARLKSALSAVVSLSPQSFDQVVNGKRDVLVEFYAPWCGHCKRLAPDYEKVAQTFDGEDSIVVAKVDADAHKELATRFSVSGYPTIKFFAKGSTDGDTYNGGRSPKEFVDFINEKSGTERVLGGGYTDKAGRIDELDQIADKFHHAAASQRNEVLREAEQVDASSHKNAEFAKFYTIAMKRILEKGDSFVTEETARLQRMLEGSNINPKQRGQFSKRINILKVFAETA